MSGIYICATQGANTGNPDCPVRMKRPKAMLPTHGKTFSLANLLDSPTFKAALKAAMLLPRTDNNKVYIFPVIRVADDNTADVNTASLADGYEEVLNESLPLFNFQSTPNICVHQAMVAFNGWTDKVFIIDVDNVLWYVATSTGGAQGFSVGSLYTNPPKFGNSSNINVANTRLLFGNIDEFKSDVGALKLDFNASSLVSIQDVKIVERAAVSTNVYTLGGLAKCSNVDIGPAYGTSMANTARWVVTRLDTGATIALTTVTYNTTLKAWVITVDSTAHSALPSGTVLSFNFADPATLDAAGVTGIEGIAITYTKP